MMTKTRPVQPGLSIVALVLMIALAWPMTAWAEGWLILGPTGFESFEGGNITLGKTSAGLIVSRSSPGTSSIYTNFPVTAPGTLGNVIDAVAVCYKTTNARTFIAATLLSERLFGSTVVGRHTDSTTHASTADECYVSQVANVTPGGAMFLRVSMTFGDPADFIVFGAIGIHFH